MAKAANVMLYYLPESDTLNPWIDDLGEEREAVPIGDNVIVKLDYQGRPIGVEILSLEKLSTDDIKKLPEERRAVYSTPRRAEKAINENAQPSTQIEESLRRSRAKEIKVLK